MRKAAGMLSAVCLKEIGVEGITFQTERERERERLYNPKDCTVPMNSTGTGRGSSG